MWPPRTLNRSTRHLAPRWTNSVSLMVEVDYVSDSVSPAEAQAAEAPSRSDVEQVDSKSRSEVDPVSHSGSHAKAVAAEA